MDSSEVGRTPPEARKPYGVRKPIPTPGPTEDDLQRTMELDNFLAGASLYENKEEPMKREQVQGQIDQGVPSRKLYGGIPKMLISFDSAPTTWRYSKGQSESTEDGFNPRYLADKAQVHARKFLVDISLDYDDAGPNPRHDPRKGRPGRNL